MKIDSGDAHIIDALYMDEPLPGEVHDGNDGLRGTIGYGCLRGTTRTDDSDWLTNITGGAHT